MKKRNWVMFLACLCLFLSACSNLKHVEEVDIWDCSVICAEESSEDSYIITYSDTTIVSNTGALTFQNQNDFDVVVHLFTNGQKERKVEIVAGGVSVLYQVEEDVDYTVGCHADVDEETEIRLMVYDGEEADPFITE